MNHQEDPFVISKHNANLVGPVVIPILFYGNIDDPSKWLSGGTGFLVKTTENRFIITAEHVIDDRDKLIKKHGNVITITGGHGKTMVDISKWQVIGRNNEIDICTLQVPDSFDPARINKKFCQPRLWPTQRVVLGEKAFTVGYPRQHRRAEEKMIIGSLLPISDFVTDVGPRRFTIADENDERILKKYTENLDDIEQFGGMSGAPIFVHRNNGWLDPVGILIEGGGIIDSIRAPLRCAHLDFIDIAGAIRTDMIPPQF
jgi:hypothetical protein